MNFHEYQAKELFAEYGIPVPPGKIASSPEQAVEVAKALGGEQWMVKAQIHAGGRGKAGGVKFCKSFDDVKAAAAGMLGKKMETYQSGGRALPVNLVLVTDATDIAKELYLSILVDRDSKAVSFIASAQGGVDIEQVARETPEDIHTIEVNFVQGLQPYQCRKLAFDMGLNVKQANQLTKIMLGLYKLFNEKDLALVELNPLAIVAIGRPDGARRQGQLRRQRRVPSSETRGDARLNRRKITPKRPRSSTTSTTSPWTATSAAWSTAPASRWRRWT